jgi:hypothetical protein
VTFERPPRDVPEKGLEVAGESGSCGGELEGGVGRMVGRAGF